MNDKTTEDLGAQDPELKNSPVAWETDEDTETLRETMPEEPACYFNDAAYEHGSVIRSGTTLLRCEYGIWIPSGSARET